MSRIFQIGLYGLQLCLLGACTTPAAATQESDRPQSSMPEILSPQDGQRIGEGNDPLCPAASKTCNRIMVEGRVPDGLTPFLAVGPSLVSPSVWVQPPIRGVRGGGSFSGLANLGEEDNGKGEYFKIYALACKDAERLQEGDEIHQFPKDCLVSDPVKVFRVR